ncbi:MAG: PAS domain S-box protein [Betaproteobacteria bacterium]|nr:PAS domain S-box protein [Betaproteobacteria bacterium]
MPEPAAASRLPPAVVHLGALRPTAALALFSALTGAAVILGTVWVLWELRDKEIVRAEREAANLAQILAEQTARAVQSADLMLRQTQERLQADEASGFLMDEKGIHRLLGARISGVPQVRTQSIFDAQGNLWRTSRAYPTPELNVADHEFFTVHRENQNTGLFIDHPARSRIDGAWGLQFSRRLDWRKGGFRGVIAVTVDPVYFEDLYKTLKLERGTSIALYLADGRLIASEPHFEERIGKSFGDSPIFETLAAAPESRQRGGILPMKGPQGTIVGYREVAGFPLVVSVALDGASMLGAWRQNAALVGGGVLGLLVLLGVAATLLARELARDETLTQALAESEARMQGIIHSAMDAIITVDEEQRVVLFNPAAEAMFGRTAAEALGAHLDLFLPQRQREAHRAFVASFRQDQARSRAMGERREIWGLRASGEEFPIDASISRVEAGGKRLYTAVVRDVTRRRESERQLRESHRQLRELSASLQTVREAERTRIARELHDELGQQLTGLKLDLSWLGSRLREDKTGLLDKIAGMKKTLDTTVAGVRRISSELRPLLLDDLGLVPAVEWLRDDFQRRSGIPVHLHVAGREFEIGKDAATAVFRILQESLTNVVRHAQASQVWIALAVSADGLRLSIRDDGRGMDASAAPKDRSFGLIGIRERAIMLGGSARISSGPGEGTVVEVDLPLNSLTSSEKTA